MSKNAFKVSELQRMHQSVTLYLKNLHCLLLRKSDSNVAAAAMAISNYHQPPSISVKIETNPRFRYGKAKQMMHRVHVC